MKEIQPGNRTEGGDTPRTQVLTPCKFLRCKEMYYEQPGMESEDDFAGNVYWCAKTQEAFGPDGEPAEKGACRCERPCYNAS